MDPTVVRPVSVLVQLPKSAISSVCSSRRAMADLPVPATPIRSTHLRSRSSRPACQLIFSESALSTNMRDEAIAEVSLLLLKSSYSDAKNGDDEAFT